MLLRKHILPGILASDRVSEPMTCLNGDIKVLPRIRKLTVFQDSVISNKQKNQDKTQTLIIASSTDCSALVTESNFRVD